MPRLECSAINCAYNTEQCCCLSGIDVSGTNAVTTEDTCCSNFCEQSSATNAATDPNPQLDVSCNACNCVHNNDHHCKAEHIQIAGQSAYNSEQTECTAFRESGRYSSNP